jgi:hypothetical protein
MNQSEVWRKSAACHDKVCLPAGHDLRGAHARLHGRRPTRRDGPGPDFIIVTRHAAISGRRAGMATGLGIASGVFVWAVVAAFGVASLLAASAVAFTVVKLIGAVYLASQPGAAAGHNIVGACADSSLPYASAASSTRSPARFWYQDRLGLDVGQRPTAIPSCSAQAPTSSRRNAVASRSGKASGVQANEGAPRAERRAASSWS